MFRTIGLMLLVGAGLVVLGEREWQLASTARDEPTTITCAQLYESGPGDNAHLIVTDALVVTSKVVYKGTKGSDRWDVVWMPVIPADTESVERLQKSMDRDANTLDRLFGTIKLVVKSTNVHDKGDLSALANARTLQGVVVNRIETLSGEERDLLRRNYPMDFGEPWLLEHERQPSGIVKRLGLLGAGILLLLIAGYKGISMWRHRPKGPAILQTH